MRVHERDEILAVLRQHIHDRTAGAHIDILHGVLHGILHCVLHRILHGGLNGVLYRIAEIVELFLKLVNGFLDLVYITHFSSPYLSKRKISPVFAEV